MLSRRAEEHRIVDLLDEWVLYQPPKSVSSGHQSRVRDPRRAWPLVQQFLAGQVACHLRPSIRLVCGKGSEWLDAAVAAERVAEANRRFGPSHRDLDWLLDSSRLSEAISFALDDDRHPKQQLDPVTVYFSYDFLWQGFPAAPKMSDTDTRNPVSSLGVHIGGRRLFLQPDLRFPAAWNTTKLRDFITAVEDKLPFRLRDHYFKRWLPPKAAKTGFGRTLKLTADWRTNSAVVVSLH